MAKDEVDLENTSYMVQQKTCASIMLMEETQGNDFIKTKVTIRNLVPRMNHALIS